MDELTDPIRRELESEWGNGATRPGLERRVSERLASASGRRARPNLLSAVALSLGAVLLLAVGINAVRLQTSQRTSPATTSTSPDATATPTVSPTPTTTPEVDYGPPPLGVDLWYYVDPRNPTWIIAVDWSGKPRGTLKVAHEIQSGYGYAGGIMAPSQDGSRIVLDQDVIDQQGHSVGALPSLGKIGVYWADDSRHLCWLTPGVSDNPAGTPQTLVSLLPGAQPRNLAQVGTAYSQTSARIEVCSFTTDRAVIAAGYNHDAEWWLVKLSTGQILRHQTVTPGNVFGRVVASHDGAVVAENVTPEAGSAASPAAAPVVIRRTSDGAVMARLTDGQQVEAFSWDGRFVITAGAASGGVDDVRLVEWQTGREIWRLRATDLPRPGDALAPNIVARPAGSDFILTFDQPPNGSSDQLQDVAILRGSGSIAVVATRVYPLAR